MTSLPTPAGCHLPRSDAQHQALEWAELSRHALRSEPLATGALVVFSADLTEAINHLVRREAECCSFLDITSTIDGGELSLSITSEHPDARSVIAALSGIEAS